MPQRMDTEAGSQGASLPFQSRVLRRIFDRSRRLDYLVVAAVTAVPMLHAWLIGAHATIANYPGYWTRPNWSLAPVAVPATLLGLRWLTSRIAPVSSSWPPSNTPAAVELVDSDEGKREAYDALRRAILAPANLVAALIVTALIMVADTGTLAAWYLGLYEGPFPEQDWSTMFVLPESGISRSSNLWLNVTAYSLAQATAVLIGILSVVVLLRHNVWFLGRIYQRRWVPEGKAASFIQIDLDDVDRCFGFRRANTAFNTQVLWLVIGGLLLQVVRFSNVGKPGSPAGLPADPMSFVLTSLPDFGQWVVAMSWLAAFLMVVLPGLVKFLPYLPIGDNKPAHSSIVGYLHEFLPDDVWEENRSAPSESLINGLAARFAANAFWPTGNNRAQQLFLFATWVFLLVLLPDARVFTGSLAPGWLVFGGALVAYAALAWLATKLAFRVLENALRFVDPRLVEARGGLPGVPKATSDESSADASSAAQIGANIFVSYRRSDTSAYSGRLHDTLESHFVPPAQLFRDLDGIEAGADFVDAIDQALDASDAMIVLIGPQWLAPTSDGGPPRIEDPSDYVHREIAGALACGVRVFPVLVGGASMPSPSELPEMLTQLARRNALEISDSRWDYDVTRLAEALGRVAPRGDGIRQPGPR
jgi:hypothetical protein